MRLSVTVHRTRPATEKARRPYVLSR